MSGKKKIDLTGQRFGRLVAIREVEPVGYHRRWLCRCDCGNETIVQQRLLRNGKTKSCGCLKKEQKPDLLGRRFGRLVVIKEVEPSGFMRRWLCICDCGNETIVHQSNLQSEQTISCGCTKKDRKKNNQKHYINGVYSPALRMKRFKNNKTGVKGVFYNYRTGKYRAVIAVKGKQYYLGEYFKLEEAASARKRGEEKYHKPYLGRAKHKPPST